MSEVCIVISIASDQSVRILECTLSAQGLSYQSLLESHNLKEWIEPHAVGFRLGVLLNPLDMIYPGDRIYFLRPSRLTPQQWRAERMQRVPVRKRKF
ncbi:MAG: hypothetical protein FJ161_02680 [Gammaproteobacteria bacterium]|nr:hypothetical protein [Gammaproteobacteria bacterium]